MVESSTASALAGKFSPMNVPASPNMEGGSKTLIICSFPPLLLKIFTFPDLRT